MSKETDEDLSPARKAIDSICWLCSITDLEIETQIVALISRLVEEIKEEEET